MIRLMLGAVGAVTLCALAVRLADTAWAVPFAFTAVVAWALYEVFRPDRRDLPTFERQQQRDERKRAA